jgi:hypothetical protein
MGLLSLLFMACSPATDAPADTGDLVQQDCSDWPMAEGDAPLFGGPIESVTATTPPKDWPIDVVRELEVLEGLVQRTTLQGQPFWGDFAAEGGLHLEASWSDDGAYDIRYDEALLLYPLPLEPSWTSTASYSQATLAHLTNQGVDTWDARWVDTVDLELDGIIFRDTAVVEATMTRELAVQAGEISWSETVWIQPCRGILARISDGQGMRILR